MNNQRLYSSRITDASALLSDVKFLLTEWQQEKTAKENFERIRSKNLFGKITRGRTTRILRAFKHRYFRDADVSSLLIKLTQSQTPSQWVDALLYFFACQNEPILRDSVIEVLYPRKQSGFIDLPVIVLRNSVRNWVSEGKTKNKWNDESIERVTQGIMATLRDFGVLEGKVNKHISTIYLPLEAFSLIAFWLMQKTGSGKLVLHSEEWKLFFLDVASVERYFFEAHQEGLLSYHAAGSVVRLEFSASNLEEYANGFLERSR